MQLLAAHRGRSLAPDTPGIGDNVNTSEVLKMQTMLLDTLNNRFAALELRLSGACGTPAWGVVEGTRTLFHASEYVPLVSCDTGQPAFYPWCSLDMGALGTFYETQTDTVLQEMEATHPDDDVQKSFNNTGASLPGRPSLPSEELPQPSEMLTGSAGNAGKNDSVQYSCVEGKMQGDNLAAVYSGGHMASPNVGELDSVSSSRPAWTPLLANTVCCPAGHTLKRQKADEVFECDVCAKDIPVGKRVFDCKKCDYSMCVKCHKQKQGEAEEAEGVSPETGKVYEAAELEVEDVETDEELDGCSRFYKLLPDRTLPNDVEDIREAVFVGIFEKVAAETLKGLRLPEARGAALVWHSMCRTWCNLGLGRKRRALGEEEVRRILVTCATAYIQQEEV